LTQFWISVEMKEQHPRDAIRGNKV
jgi:hypothetical protein